MNKDILQAKFEQGLSFSQILEAAERDGNRDAWQTRYAQLELDESQKSLVESFTREMNVLCMTGPWCGDCALQGAAMQRVAEANPNRIHLRYVIRSDEHAELVVKAAINAGFRVPVTWFMAEDFEPVAWFGDRTLSRYRSMARKALGERSNVLAPPPEDPVREVLHEVLDEFERVHLLLRLSTRPAQNA